MAQQTRKDPRAKVLSMTVRYKSATLDEFIEHHSHDVSRGGMFIKTPQPFPPGTLLKFEVRIAEDRKVMQGVGRVVWKRDLNSADAERPGGMGVKFIKLDDDSRRLIDQLLSTRRDELSAFDAESSQPGVDTEAMVGLGTDLLSVPGGADVQSFFPRNDPAELPPPEDRTVMKQAAELLEEALREVGSDEPAKLPKLPSLSPVAADEKEDTKPGRVPNSSDSVARLPAPKMPAGKAVNMPAPAPKPPEAERPKSSVPAKAGGEVTIDAAVETKPADLATAARGITEKARAVAASKAPSPPAAKSASVGAPAGKVPSKAAATAATSASQSKPVTAQSAPLPQSAGGSGRAAFWLAAVAICAAGTWWLWKPRPVEPLPNPPVQSEPVTKPPEPAAAPPVLPSAVIAEVASAEAPAASAASAAASAVPSAAAEASVPVAVATTAAVPAPAAAPKVVVPSIGRTGIKPKSAPAADSPAQNTVEPAAPSEPAAPAAPEAPAAPKEVSPTEAKPAVPATEPAAPASPTPAVPPAAEAPKKRKAPAADSDNPY